MIAIVVAEANNHVIGSKNDLPWYVPADLKHFRELTTGSTVIMGRKTYESIVGRLNGPLPNRKNIVISSTLEGPVEGFEVVDSLEEAVAVAQKETGDIYIIGGASLYNSSLDKGIVDTIFLTKIDAEIDGDTYFAELDPSQWRETERDHHQADDKNKYPYTFITLKKVPA